MPLLPVGGGNSTLTAGVWLGCPGAVLTGVVCLNPALFGTVLGAVVAYTGSPLSPS